MFHNYRAKTMTPFPKQNYEQTFQIVQVRLYFDDANIKTRITS